jgi:hypothetical protein
MIILTKGQTTDIYVTPQEKTNVVYSTYYFKFTNRITQSVIEYTYDNISSFSRYQQFTIDAIIFEDYDTGFWTYEINGWDDNLAEPVEPTLESGFMYLNPAQTFEPTTYDEQSNSFLTYNG